MVDFAILEQSRSFSNAFLSYFLEGVYGRFDFAYISWVSHSGFGCTTKAISFFKETLATFADPTVGFLQLLGFLHF